jgi:hypothetical protein
MDSHNNFGGGLCILGRLAHALSKIDQVVSVVSFPAHIVLARFSEGKHANKEECDNPGDQTTRKRRALTQQRGDLKV